MKVKLSFDIKKKKKAKNLSYVYSELSFAYLYFVYLKKKHSKYFILECSTKNKVDSIYVFG